MKKIAALGLTAGFMAMSATPALANGYILQGIADIPRHAKTGPIDGCAKVQKGLMEGGGFLLFTCEKLLPEHAISQHQTAFKDYQSTLETEGWKVTKRESDKVAFSRSDESGCKANLDLTLWKDRSMNEPMRPAADRDAHRQIVFMARFEGSACERYYSMAQALAD